MLELVKGQVFGLALDVDVAARAETSRNREIAWNIDCIIPGVEFLLDGTRYIDPPHLQGWRHLGRLFDWMGVHRKDLTIGIAQKIAPDPAGSGLLPRR